MSKRKSKGNPIGKLALGVHGCRTSTKRARRVFVETAEGIHEVSLEEVLPGMVKRAAVEAVRGRPAVVPCLECDLPVKVSPSPAAIPKRCAKCRKKKKTSMQSAWKSAHRGRSLERIRKQRAECNVPFREREKRARARKSAEQRRLERRRYRQAHPEKERLRKRLYRAKKKAEREAAAKKK